MMSSLRALAGGAVILGLILLASFGGSNAAPPVSQTCYPVTGATGSLPGQCVNGFMNMWYDGAANAPRAAGNDYPLPVTMSGSISTTPSGTQNVAVTNFPGTQPVSVTPNRGTATKGNAIVGTTPTVLVPAQAGRSQIFISNWSETAVLACTLDGTAPTYSATTPVGLPVWPKGNLSATGAAGAFMPVGALTCVASAAGTPVYWSFYQ